MQGYLKISAAIALLSALSACTSSAPPSGATVTAANAGGKVCIRTLEIRKQTVLSDQEIKFEMSNGDVWVNHLPVRCSGLKAQGGFAWEVHNANVCSNQEIIHVLDWGTSCAIGEFEKQPPAT